MIGIALEEQRWNFIAGKAFHRKGRQEDPQRAGRKAPFCVLSGFLARFAVQAF